MAKKSTKVDTKPVINEVETDEEVHTDTPNRPINSESLRKFANKLTVTLPNGEQRVYSPFTHGKVWEALAHNFAEANKGSVIE
jgi:hypothetical protein